MDITKYPQDTQLIIGIEEEIRADLRKLGYEDVELSAIDPVLGINMMYFMTCMHPESVCYGRGTGVFV